MAARGAAARCSVLPPKWLAPLRCATFIAGTRMRLISQNCGVGVSLCSPWCAYAFAAPPLRARLRARAPFRLNCALASARCDFRTSDARARRVHCVKFAEPPAWCKFHRSNTRARARASHALWKLRWGFCALPFSRTSDARACRMHCGSCTGASAWSNFSHAMRARVACMA